MKVVFFFNYLNHHQVLVADEMYGLVGNGFRFVSTLPRNANELKGGADYSLRPYCILAGESDDARAEAMVLARTADMCVFGACSEDYAVERAKENPCGLSFQVGERWLKHGWLSVLSPMLRRWFVNYHRYYRKANFHKLCASAFAAHDDDRLHVYGERHYKWGYFTQVAEENRVEASCQDVSTPATCCTQILWCSRLLVLKHPELPVMMAARLKAKGYNFGIDMYGDDGAAAAMRDGVYSRSRLQSLIERYGVSDCVRLRGSRPNDEILRAMRDSDIFLFTSDCQEGWGAVANESMANGCVLVASDAIGSAPYLVESGVNGFLFSSEDVDSLTEKVEWLLEHPEECRRMQRNAYLTMRDNWSPRVAAGRLLRLADDLLHGRQTSIEVGPCSKA